MIHEILLSLSGHPSPLFQDDQTANSHDFPLLSPSEKALLKTIGRLSLLHRNIRQHIQTVHTNHKSLICKAVASTIENLHLAKFQQKILNVEQSILKNDPSIVGAYNIVPLASIVSEFAEWHRLLDWLWDTISFIQPTRKTDLPCSGPQLINRLRKNAQTGYPDIEEAAIQLSKAAEAAWLRQLANWILYGQISKYGSEDFFIQPVASGSSIHAEYEISHSRIPSFLSQSCATSILFVGNALHQISSRVKEAKHSKIHSQLDLLRAHQEIISNLRLPLSTVSLSEVVNSIRTSLSRNVLDKLLPIEEVLRLLAILRRYFLLEQGEFGNSLIREADERTLARSRTNMHTISSKDGLKGMIMKEQEIKSILSKTWIHLSALAADDDDELDVVEMGRDLIRLSLSRSSGKTNKDVKTPAPKIHNAFNSFLLPVPTTLEVDVQGTFDLFISPSEVQTYSSINAYLLAIRRGHIHLANLWKQSQIRREHPTPLGPPRSCTDAGRQRLQARRARSFKRCIEMRKFWATASAVIFLLNELGDFFEGQVIPSMWDHLLQWIRQGTEHQSSDSQHSHASIDTLATSHINQDISLSSINVTTNSITAPTLTSHDPASLAAAHKTFLTSLSHALLITDVSFTTALSSLLHSSDDLVAQITRLQTIQSNLDLESDQGVFDAMTNYTQELTICQTELDRARKRVDSGSKTLVARLRDLSDSGTFNHHHNVHRHQEDERAYAPSAYTPIPHAKLEWLLMKLEFSNPQTQELHVAGFNDE